MQFILVVSRLALAVPLFPHASWRDIRRIYLGWARCFRALFLPFAFYDMCQVRSSNVVICDLESIKERLDNLVFDRSEEVRKFCSEANVRDGIAILFHTEYQCMIWNWNELIDIYADAIVRCVKRISSSIKVELDRVRISPRFYICRTIRK